MEAQTFSYIFVCVMLLFGVIATYSTLQQFGIGTKRDRKYNKRGTLEFKEFIDTEETVDGEKIYTPVATITYRNGENQVLQLDKKMTAKSVNKHRYDVHQVRVNPAEPKDFVFVEASETKYRRLGVVVAIGVFCVFLAFDFIVISMLYTSEGIDIIPPSISETLGLYDVFENTAEFFFDRA